MALHHYDIRLEELQHPTGFIVIERVYGLNFDAFDDRDWTELMNIYRALPAFIEVDNTSVPCWFGSDCRKAPHLTASVELPGLQVVGALERGDFEAWDVQFKTLADHLPQRNVA